MLTSLNSKKLKHTALLWLVGRVLAPLLKLWFGTCRLEVLTPDTFSEGYGAAKGSIGVTWHRGAVFFLYFFGPKRPAIMISRSKDGAYLARYLEAMGGIPVRGSSSAGGTAALKAMVDHLKHGAGHFAATVADGPRGPRYRAKQGMVKLASQTGLPLYPLMWSADRCIVFKKSWDLTMIPKPFARVKIMAGKGRTYPADISPAELKAATRELEDELNAMRKQLDRACGLDLPE